MAGSNPFTKNIQKGKYNPAFDSAEVYKAPASNINSISSILTGILRPGETIDFSDFKKETKTLEKPKFDNYLQKEKSLYVDQHTQETENMIKELQQEIKSLKKATDNLDHELDQSTNQDIHENNKYQLSFLERLKNLVIQFRRNINEAGTWLESFNHKKSKCNAYRNRAKSGGTKYTDSGEHAVARSAN